jgi:hypothetical protein
MFYRSDDTPLSNTETRANPLYNTIFESNRPQKINRDDYENKIKQGTIDKTDANVYKIETNTISDETEICKTCPNCEELKNQIYSLKEQLSSLISIS